MTDWTHKRLLEKLDRMQAQRDKLLADIERLMACADDIPAHEDMVAILNDEDAPEGAKQQAEAFLSLMATIEDVKYPRGCKRIRERSVMKWNAEKLLQAVAASSPSECITQDRMAEITGMEPVQVERACLKLRKHGLLWKTAQGCHKLTDAGLEAAAAGKTLRSGPTSYTAPKINKDSLRIRAWRAMRIRRKFSIPDLCMLVAQGGEKDIESNVGKYVRALEKAGYLIRMAKREAGVALTSNGHIRYWLPDDKDTGPLAPVWRVAAGEVYDPNTESTALIGKSKEVRHVI